MREEINPKYRIGLTEKHGMAHELSQFPPAGIEYSFLTHLPARHQFIRSPIKGYFRNYSTNKHDLIEAILSPIFTSNRWIYSLANFQEALAFSFYGLPTPRQLRLRFIKRIFLKENFKKLVFWSKAGKETLFTYGKIKDHKLISKADVVYPAIRKVPKDLIHFRDKADVNILFSGDFFRKGGVNAIDAFERVQRIHPKIKLKLCCDLNIDFNTNNIQLKNIYLRKIKNNPQINYGRISREEMINKVLPSTDIYLIPTYIEAFGFAILEAMAYGIPVITTNHFAIPEMVKHNINGFLIDTKKFKCDELFKGYFVNKIPADFNNYLTDSVFECLCQLIESVKLRKQLGLNGLDIAKTGFSFETRNKKMLEIYSSCFS